MHKIIFDPLCNVKTAGLSVSILAIIAMTVSDVSIVTAVLVTLLGAIHVISGGLVYQSLARRVLRPPEFLGFGFAIGSLMALCIDQLFVSTFFRDWSWTLLLVLILILSSIQARANQLDITTEAPDSRSGLSLVFLFVFTFALLVQERYWPLVIVIGVFPLAILAQPTTLQKLATAWHRRIAIATSSTLAVLTITSTIATRPSLWWIKTQDFQFFESLSYSLSHFGSRDQVFVSGYAVEYHWFSYGWVGLIARITHAEQWVILTRAAPILTVIAILMIMIHIFSKSNLKGSSLVIAIFIFVALNDFNFESFSMVHSYVWLVSAVWLLVEFAASPRITHYTLAPFLAAGAYGAKSSNIAVLLAVLGVVVIISLYRRPTRKWETSALVIAHASALGIIHYFLYLKSTYSSTVQIGTMGIARNYFGDLGALGHPKLLVASGIVLINLVALHLWATAIFGWRNHKPAGPIVIAALGAITGGVVPLLIVWSDDYELEEYFLHAMVIFTSVTVAIITSQFLSESLRRAANIRRWLLLISVVVVTTIWSQQPITNEGTELAIFTRVITQSHIFLSLLVLLLVFLIFARIKKYSARITTQMLVALCSVSVISLNQPWFYNFSNFSKEITAANHSAFMLGEPSVIRGALLVREFTKEHDIIASNYFCEKSLCPVVEYGASRVDWKRGGEAMTLAIYSQRRYWVTGYGFLWQNTQPPVAIRRRIADSLTALPRNVDITYFLRDKTMPCSCDESWTLIASSNRFELFKI